MKRARHGIYAAAISPFTEELKLDAGKLARYCSHLVSDGRCDGVAPAGTTGEGPSIELADRLAIPAALEREGLEPDQVILGVGTSSFGDTLRLSRTALDHGYGNLLVLPSFYYKNQSEEDVYTYFARLADVLAKSGANIYLYHFPQMSAVPITANVVRRLRSEFGNRVAGIKDSSGEYGQTLNFLSGTGGRDAGFDVFPSSEGFLPQALDAGCAGVISATINILGPHARRALRSGTRPGANPYRQLADARLHIQEYPLIPAVKTCHTERCGDEGWLRTLPPQASLGPDDENRLLDGLAAILDRGA